MKICEGCGKEFNHPPQTAWVWWTPEIHFTCSNDCFRKAYLGVK